MGPRADIVGMGRSIIMTKTRFIAGAVASVGAGAVILASSAQADWFTYSTTKFDYTASGQTIAYQVDVNGSQHMLKDKTGKYISIGRPLAVFVDFGDGGERHTEFRSDEQGCSALEGSDPFEYHSPSAPVMRPTHHYAAPGTYTVTTEVYFCGTYRLNDSSETEKWTVTVGADGSVTPTPSPTTSPETPAPTTSTSAPTSPATSTTSAPTTSSPAPSSATPSPTSSATSATPAPTSTVASPVPTPAGSATSTSPAGNGASTVVGPVVQTDKVGNSNEMVTLGAAVLAAGAAGAGVALRRRTQRN